MAECWERWRTKYYDKVEELRMAEEKVELAIQGLSHIYEHSKRSGQMVVEDHAWHVLVRLGVEPGADKGSSHSKEGK